MESGNSEPETAASLGCCTCFAIVPVTAAVFHLAYFTRMHTSTTFNVVEGTGHRTAASLLRESHCDDAYSKAGFFPISWFSHVLGHCHGWFLHVLGHCPGQGVRSQRSKIGPKISQISRYIGQIRWRFEIDRPKGLQEARRCRSVRKLLFPFSRARAKCGRNGPSMHTHGGIRVRQTPKVLRLRSSFGRAGETKFAPKWVGRTDRARNKALWTHQGP